MNRHLALSHSRTALRSTVAIIATAVISACGGGSSEPLASSPPESATRSQRLAFAVPAPTTSSYTVVNIDANDPVAVGVVAEVGLTFSGVNASDTAVVQWNWGDGNVTSTGVVPAESGAGTASGSHIYADAGVYNVSATVVDSTGTRVTAAMNVVVYDPSAGFVTGGGWINSPKGAYRADPTLAGRASFGFVAHYVNGATQPTGNTEFQFHADKLNFHSRKYDWLVVAGARAQYKGEGSIDGKEGFRFLLTAVDGDLIGKGTRDRFRIKIWHTDQATGAEAVDYDNQIDSTLGGGGNSEGTTLAGGNIMIHKKN